MQERPSSSKIFHVTVVEPGYFRTDSLGASALSVSPSRIAGYGATADRVPHRRGRAQPPATGQFEHLTDVLVAFADAPIPAEAPAARSDTVAAIEAKHAVDRAILAEWYSVPMSTGSAAG
jgi:hypothetical protein